jgi:hypothetical protein
MKTYDEKCYELAVYFLDADSPGWGKANKIKLAQEIQETIESFLNFEEKEHA